MPNSPPSSLPSTGAAFTMRPSTSARSCSPHAWSACEGDWGSARQKRQRWSGGERRAARMIDYSQWSRATPQLSPPLAREDVYTRTAVFVHTHPHTSFGNSNHPTGARKRARSSSSFFSRERRRHDPAPPAPSPLPRARRTRHQTRLLLSLRLLLSSNLAVALHKRRQRRVRLGVDEHGAVHEAVVTVLALGADELLRTETCGRIASTGRENENEREREIERKRE